MIRRFIVCMMVLGVGCAYAQSPSDEVKKFLRFDDASIALTHVRIIDGTGAAPQEDRTLLLRQGHIAAIQAASAPIPHDARVIDLGGRSVIPGLVGMHDHLMYTASINDGDGKIPAPGFLVTELAFSAPRLYLASGVTTMRTTGSVEPYTDLNIRRQIDAQQIPGPHLDVTGPYLEGSGSFFPQMTDLTEPEQARRTVAFWVQQGVTSMKAYMNITEAVLGAAIDESHRQHIKITGHLCAVDYHQAAALGIDNLEHGPIYTDTEFVPGRKHDTCPSGGELAASWQNLTIDGPQVQALMHDLIKRNVAITSTLPVFEAMIPTRQPLSQHQMESMSSESLRSYLYERTKAAANANPSNQEALFKKEMAFELAFVRAGGLLLAGPDPTGNGGVLPGFGDQREIELLVEAGFTPLEAIHIGTANGARYLGRLDRIGTIEVGKSADLVVIKGNPGAHIEDIENVEWVFKDGMGYDPAKLIGSVRGMVGIR
jgi:hypothetical protein